MEEQTPVLESSEVVEVLALPLHSASLSAAQLNTLTRAEMLAALGCPDFIVGDIDSIFTQRALDEMVLRARELEAA